MYRLWKVCEGMSDPGDLDRGKEAGDRRRDLPRMRRMRPELSDKGDNAGAQTDTGDHAGKQHPPVCIAGD